MNSLRYDIYIIQYRVIQLNQMKMFLVVYRVYNILYINFNFFQSLINYLKMFNQWCTIESDPGVFSDLINRIGVPTVQVEQLYSIDEQSLLQRIQPIYGFIFLFKWTKDPEPRECLTLYDNQLFFANQVITNACATQAILAVLLNSPIQIGGTLKEFYQFTKDLSSYDKGLALSNSEDIRKIHNSFNRPEPFIFKQDRKKKRKEADVYHFISYVPFKNALYELDGLQKGPIKLGNFEGNDWIPLARLQIEKRIHKYSEKEIRFNLLAVCENLKTKAIRQIDNLNKEKLQILNFLKISEYEGDIYSQLENLKEKYPDALQVQLEQTDTEKLVNRLPLIDEQVQNEQLKIVEEQQKYKIQKKQNIRRKHNYMPLILQMLKIAAKKGKITQILEARKNKTK